MNKEQKAQRLQELLQEYATLREAHQKAREARAYRAAEPIGIAMFGVRAEMRQAARALRRAAEKMGDGNGQ